MILLHILLSVTICFNVSNDLSLILWSVMVQIRVMRFTVWNTASTIVGLLLISHRWPCVGWILFLHIIHGNIMAGGRSICIHMYMERPKTHMAAPCMRARLILVSNHTLIQDPWKCLTWVKLHISSELIFGSLGHREVSTHACKCDS